MWSGVEWSGEVMIIGEGVMIIVWRGRMRMNARRLGWGGVTPLNLVKLCGPLESSGRQTF